jgi:diacylglycerol kinase family enzyme
MIALLANPGSGSGEAGEVESSLRARGVDFARFDLDAADDVAEAMPERVIVAGGDGSVGCAAAIAAKVGAPLGVVAVGTANDFARTMDLPEDLAPGLDLALEGRRTRRLDLGWVGERPFVNAASAGLSPVAARKAHGLKGLLGPVAYTVGALRAGLFAQPVRCTVDVDADRLFEGGAWQVTVGLTGAFGGGAEVDADPADGALDAVVLAAGSRLRLVHHAYGLRAGRVEEQAGVVTARGQRVRIRAESDAGFNVDGELLEQRELEFSLEPGAFEVVVG